MISSISSRTLRRFFESSPLPLTLSSPAFSDCPLIMVNQAFCELTGYTEDEVIGHNCRFLQGTKTSQAARSKLRRAITWQDEALVQITNYRRDGSTFENLVFVLPIFSPSGRLLYILGSQCDVSAGLTPFTASEHAEMLDETVNLSNPQLAHQDDLLIRIGKPRLEAYRDLISESGPGDRSDATA